MEIKTKNQTKIPDRKLTVSRSIIRSEGEMKTRFYSDRASNYVEKATIVTPQRDFPEPPSFLRDKPVTLAEALDRVLDKGAILQGDLMLRIADVDLVYVGLRLIITSISRMEKLKGGEDFKRGYTEKEREADLKYIKEVQREIEKASRNIPKIIDTSSPKTAEKGLAKLVLTLVKLIKDLTEKEARRRIEQGNLTDLEIQKLGVTFKALDKKMEELKAVFGLKEKELNLDLGPLGQLM